MRAVEWRIEYHNDCVRSAIDSFGENDYISYSYWFLRRIRVEMNVKRKERIAYE